MKHVLKLKAEKTTKKLAPKRKAAKLAPKRQAVRIDVDEMLDEALSETFPASDPVALTQPSRRRRAQLRKRHASRRI
jgi:hypothetical protein